jgi:hypothetical protein
VDYPQKKEKGSGNRLPDDHFRAVYERSNFLHALIYNTAYGIVNPFSAISLT